VIRIDIDDHQNDVGQVGCRLAVKEDLVVIREMEPQPMIELQGGVAAPDPVY
jgi:hypothetical protein